MIEWAIEPRGRHVAKVGRVFLSVERGSGDGAFWTVSLGDVGDSYAHIDHGYVPYQRKLVGLRENCEKALRDFVRELNEELEKP